MFYCDKCAKRHQYPINGSEEMKSLGPCEICDEILPCNDFHHSLLELGAVTIYYLDAAVFLKPDKSSFHAPLGHYRIIGFDLKHVRKHDNQVLVPVNYTQDFTDKNQARAKVRQLREQKNKENQTQQYFLHNQDGYMEKIDT